MIDETTEKNLTPAQLKAIESLLTTGNIASAAKAAGVHRSSLYRWMADDEAFKAALRTAEETAVQSLATALVGLGESAVTALHDALSKSNKITVRLRAAEIVTDRLLKIRELVQFEARLKALEDKSDAPT